jgi:hypothetical protein
VPLTELQQAILSLIGASRTSYVAGETALHFTPESTRYSHDLDLFHDAEERVAEAFASDRALLEAGGFQVDTVLSQPGFIRAVVSRDGSATQIDWAHDSSCVGLPTRPAASTTTGPPTGSSSPHRTEPSRSRVW